MLLYKKSTSELHPRLCSAVYVSYFGGGIIITHKIFAVFLLAAVRVSKQLYFDYSY